MDKTHKKNQPAISVSTASSSESPTPEVINISGADTDANGFEAILNNMQGLPPEAQEKIRAAMLKLQFNPGVMNMLKMGLDMGKAASQNGGVFVKTFTTKAGSQFINNPNSISMVTAANTGSENSANAPSSTPLNMRPNKVHQRDPITFNPDIKKDHWRRQIFIFGLIILGSYLIFKYVYNGQLPF